MTIKVDRITCPKCNETDYLENFRREIPKWDMSEAFITDRGKLVWLETGDTDADISQASYFHDHFCGLTEDQIEEAVKLAVGRQSGDDQ